MINITVVLALRWSACSLSICQKLSTVGFDINEKKVEALRQGIDYTGEVSTDELKPPLSKSLQT